jgi:hypothetical protein
MGIFFYNRLPGNFMGIYQQSFLFAIVSNLFAKMRWIGKSYYLMDLAQFRGTLVYFH